MTMHTQPEPSNHPIWRVLRTHPLLALRGGWDTLTDVRIPPTATALEKGRT